MLHLITLGVWILYVGTKLTGLAHPELPKVVTFWALSIVLVSGGRAVARFICRRLPAYRQNTVIVGAGDVGQLVARKFIQHPEYGINLVGFVDADPLGCAKTSREAESSAHAGRARADWSATWTSNASSSPSPNERPEELPELVARLKRLDVQIDIVPRLFDVVGPNVTRARRRGASTRRPPTPKLLAFSRKIKRAMDIVGASLLLLLTAPLFAVRGLADQARLAGPVFFRQARIGQGMRPFTALKFRTMKVDTDDSLHREFIKATMDSKATPDGEWPVQARTDRRGDGRRALAAEDESRRAPAAAQRPERRHVARRPAAVPRVRDRELRAASFERFRVPAGVTGLWQVTARAHSTFGEALDLDVAYARNWSLALDSGSSSEPRSSAATQGDRVVAVWEGQGIVPVRTAVVGLGYWGPNLVRNLQELPDADLVGGLRPARGPAAQDRRSAIHR